MSFGSKTTTKPAEAVRTTSAATTTPTVPRVPETKASAVEFKSAFVTGGTAAGRTPGTEDIRRRAYEIYQARRVSGASGTPDTDWSQAERELRVMA